MDSELFRATMKKYMELRHIWTREQLRKHTTIGSNTTFGKYWKNPELIPIGQFLRMCDALNVPHAERWEMLK